MNEKTRTNGIFSHFFTKILTRKNPDEMIKTANAAGFKKTLTAVDLVILGIGAIIGSGIFAVVGIAAAGGPDLALPIRLRVALAAASANRGG